MEQVISHRNGMQKIIEKNIHEFQIQQGFNYLVWNQLYVGTKDFATKFATIKDIFRNDSLFRDYVKKDCDDFGREMEENQVNFFLEEMLMFYLTLYGQVKLPNEYIDNNQKWILNCYPGKPLRGTIYLGLLNPFKFKDSGNPYLNAQYDLDSKQLIRYEDVNLETYSVK